MGVEQVHEEKQTDVVDVNLPGHDARVTTPLFSRTRDELLKMEGGRSFVTGRTAEEVGMPHEAHHFWIERCLADAADWQEFCKYISRMKELILRTSAFCEANPELTDIYSFVDNMTVNGMLIEKELHTGHGLSIHRGPFPLWQFWIYGKEGFQFVQGEAVYHEDEARPITAADLPPVCPN